MITAAQFSSSLSGVQRHAFNVVRCLIQRPEISEVHIVLSPWQRDIAETSGLLRLKRVVLHLAAMEQTLWSRNRWYYRHLPKLVAQLQPDVLHLSYPVPINASAIACPVVLSLHDLYPYEIPENFGFPKVFFNRMILRHCLRSVEAVACVSDTTLLRLRQYIPLAKTAPALRIYNCVEARTAYAETSPFCEFEGKPFLLSVSQHRKNKNIDLLVRALSYLLRDGCVASDMKLVVVGIPGPETISLRRLVTALRLDESVVFLHGISEARLQRYYEQCEVLVAPSETEGFGLPVAEALLAGCRVVCSDIPAFREIAEDSCHFVALGPGAEERLAEAIVASLQRPRDAPVSLPQFSSEVLGAQYASLYQSLVAEARVQRARRPFETQKLPFRSYS